MNSRGARLQNILAENLQPLHMEINNESHLHSVPANSETHFKVLIVSNVFSDISRIDRQRLVNDLVKFELQSGLHALAQRLLSPSEWEAQKAQLQFRSPECAGASKSKV